MKEATKEEEFVAFLMSYVRQQMADKHAGHKVTEIAIMDLALQGFFKCKVTTLKKICIEGARTDSTISASSF